jgi:hypothetical protein
MWGCGRGGGMRRVLGLCLVLVAVLACWVVSVAAVCVGGLEGVVAGVVAFVGGVVCGVRFAALLDARRAARVDLTVLVAWLVALVVAGISGAQIYHGHVGERTRAVIVGTRRTEGRGAPAGGGLPPRGTSYRLVEVGTERDLGWMVHGPRQRAHKGERVVVSVDPRGWVAPVAAERLGGTTAPSVLLGICAGSIVVVVGCAVVGQARAGRRKGPGTE